MNYTIELPTNLTNTLQRVAAAVGVPENDLLQTILKRHLETLGRLGWEAEEARSNYPLDWQEFGRRMSEGVTAPALPDSALTRTSIYEED